jgi:hypothetical protein
VHSIVRNEAGEYEVEYEQGTWRDYFISYNKVHVVPGDPLTVYTSIFAPTKFGTDIVHEWQYYNEQQRRWNTMSRIPLYISGGRDGGFRTYSSKGSLMEGKWRVNVKTPRGQHIGRIKFYVEEVEAQPIFTVKVLE